MRQFVEFYSNDEDQAWLEIQAYALRSGEVEKLISELEKKGFNVENVQADSLRAKKEGSYKEVSQIVRDLTKQDFCWSEAGKEVEEKGEIATREEYEQVG